MQRLRVDGTIFVVDDDEAVRDSLALLLEAVGLKVEAFAGGAEVLARCRETRPTCVFTDVRMPGMDGLELQQSYRISIPIYRSSSSPATVTCLWPSRP
jgi:FixJ family two-component response regulator